MPSLASLALGTSRTVRRITCRRRDSYSIVVLSGFSMLLSCVSSVVPSDSSVLLFISCWRVLYSLSALFRLPVFFRRGSCLALGGVV